MFFCFRLSPFFFFSFFFLLDQVLKHRVKVSLHGAWTESQCAGKTLKQLSFSYANMINRVSWFHKWLDHKMLFVFAFLKAWLGELDYEAFIFSPYLNLFSFQYLKD